MPNLGLNLDQIAIDPRFNTPLPPHLVKAYAAWKKKNSPNDSGYDYDLPGAFLAGMSRDAETHHFDDTFKKPNHPTFSTFSKYAPLAPELAGTWDGNKYIPSPLNPIQGALQSATRPRSIVPKKLSLLGLE